MAIDKIQISVLFDTLFKTAVQREVDGKIRWKERFSELPEIYRQTHEEVDEISKLKKKPKVLERVKEIRTAQPVPNTENHVYGWLAGRNEFVLENLGPDVMTSIPLPKEYKLEERGAKRNFLML